MRAGLLRLNVVRSILLVFRLARPWALATILSTVVLLDLSLHGPIVDWRLWSSLAGIALLAFGGFAINDYFDADLDRVVHPDRVIPRGLATKREVLRVACVSIFSGVIILWTNGLTNVLIGISVAVLLVLYSPGKNLHGFLGNIIISLVLTMTVVYVFATSNVDYSLTSFLLLSLALLFASLAQEAVKDIEDVEAERPFRRFRRTVPAVFGTVAAFRYASACLTIALTLIALATFMTSWPVAWAVMFPLLLYGFVLAGLMFFTTESSQATRTVVMLKVGMSAMLIALPILV
jgi:4-hydroxybenzoate polyprenyltransferase